MTMLAAAAISLAVLFAPTEQNQTPIAGCQSPAAEDALAQPTEPLMLSGFPCGCCDRAFEDCEFACQSNHPHGSPSGYMQCLAGCEQEWNECMVGCDPGVFCDP